MEKKADELRLYLYSVLNKLLLKLALIELPRLTGRKTPSYLLVCWNQLAESEDMPAAPRQL